MIIVKNAEIQLTEQTVRELISAIEKVKEEVEFTTDPMSGSDMSEEQFIEEQKKRGIIRVKSSYSKIEFRISLETKPRTQESLGYKLI
ncbi:MAG: hypothetical protein ACFFG0_01800 [Candidatus Thorarchaeota archaeon]